MNLLNKEKMLWLCLVVASVIIFSVNTFVKFANVVNLLHLLFSKNKLFFLGGPENINLTSMTWVYLRMYAKKQNLLTYT